MDILKLISGNTKQDIIKDSDILKEHNYIKIEEKEEEEESPVLKMNRKRWIVPKLNLSGLHIKRSIEEKLRQQDLYNPKSSSSYTQSTFSSRARNYAFPIKQMKNIKKKKSKINKGVNNKSYGTARVNRRSSFSIEKLKKKLKKSNRKKNTRVTSFRGFKRRKSYSVKSFFKHKNISKSSTSPLSKKVKKFSKKPTTKLSIINSKILQPQKTKSAKLIINSSASSSKIQPQKTLKTYLEIEAELAPSLSECSIRRRKCSNIKASVRGDEIEKEKEKEKEKKKKLYCYNCKTEIKNMIKKRRKKQKKIFPGDRIVIIYNDNINIGNNFKKNFLNSSSIIKIFLNSTQFFYRKFGNELKYLASFGFTFKLLKTFEVNLKIIKNKNNLCFINLSNFNFKKHKKIIYLKKKSSKDSDDDDDEKREEEIKLNELSKVVFSYIEKIYFFRDKDPFYQLSPYYHSKFRIEGKEYKSCLHYYESQKFEDPRIIEHINRLNVCSEIKNFSKKMKEFKKRDWSSQKLLTMKRALLAKFSQNLELKRLLLLTHPKIELIHSPNINKIFLCDLKKEKNIGKLLEELRLFFYRKMQNKNNFLLDYNFNINNIQQSKNKKKKNNINKIRRKSF